MLCHTIDCAFRRIRGRSVEKWIETARMEATGAAERVRGWGQLCGRLGLRLLFPPRCASCDLDLEDAPGDLLLCDDCQQMLGPPSWRFCRRCGAAAIPGELPAATCPRCEGQRLHFDAVLSLGHYHGGLRPAVLKMKHRQGETLAVALAELLVRRRRADLEAFRPHLVLPVPMHWWRRLGRGFNSPERPGPGPGPGPPRALVPGASRPQAEHLAADAPGAENAVSEPPRGPAAAGR